LRLGFQRCYSLRVLTPDISAWTVAFGTRIGSFRIESHLGAGGMGTVFRALDEKLNRPVAVKFLGDAFLDGTARARFQREARLASSLNHPHILTVHDVGEFSGRQYLITEFVDGGTLNDWARAGLQTWHQVVDLLVGVADGLAAAHEAGIVHRDVKPANILVSRNGYAKLADFGLAKLAQESRPTDVTRTANETNSDRIIGTIAYMSPEQASGKPVDARSDIFSFGVVLHELLSGVRPFDGGTDLEVLYAVIHHAPKPLKGDIPAPLRMTVEKALEKDVAHRYQSMREMVVDLRRVARSGTELPRPSVAGRPRRWLVPALAVIALAAVGAASWLAFWRERPADNPIEGASFLRMSDFPGDELGAAISRDGTSVVFLSERDGQPDLWIRQVGTNSFRNLTRALPQGRYAPNPRGSRPGGFTFDGSQVWISGPPPVTARLSLVPIGGGALQPFLPERSATVAWSPDGAHIVYLVNTPGDPLFVANADGSNARQVFVSAEGLHNHFATFSADGRWIYFAHGQVVNFQFDLWRIPVAGGQAEQLTHHNEFVGYPTPIDARTILYVAEDQGAGPWLWAYDVNAKSTRRVTTGLDRYLSIAGSADGRRLVAAVNANPVASLWSVPIVNRELDANEMTAYKLPTSRGLAPRFAGDTLFYLSSLDGGDGLWRVKDGQASEIWKGSDGPLSVPPAVSPDGQRVVVVLNQQGKRRLRVIPVDGEPLPAIESLEVRGAPTWSPDGQWIATGGNDGTGDGLFKVPVAGGPPVRLADSLAFSPVWARTRPLIVYAGPNVNAEQRLLAVSPDGKAVDFPAISTYGEGILHRLTPDDKSLIYVGRSGVEAEFTMLDLDTNRRRVVGHFNARQVRAFDVTPDGKRLVFDMIQQNSDIYLIDRRGQ
jgi:Tol biopolymer transport system component